MLAKKERKDNGRERERERERERKAMKILKESVEKSNERDITKETRDVMKERNK